MDAEQKLFQAALLAFNRAYAPYSSFRVGAAVLGSNGGIYSGCNVENISFPCGSCAEQGAIAAMVADGEHLIKTILILADGQELITPCGACLQRILEFSDSQTLVCLADTRQIRHTCRLTELLPHAFAAKELKS